MNRTALRVGIWLAIVGAVAGAGRHWSATTDQLLSGILPEVVLPLVAAVAVVVVWLVVHSRRGREPRVETTADVVAPPSEHRPAEVGWLVGYGVTTTQHLAATLIDLADRDVIRVAAETGTLTRVSAVEAHLVPHEQLLLDWLFATSTHATVEETSAAVRAAPRSWQCLFDDFSQALDIDGAQSGLVERAADTEEVLSVGLLCASVIVAGAIGVARISPVWLACTAAAALVLVFADTLARRSPHGALLASQWQQFCRRMSDGDAEVVARHAAYALALEAVPSIPLTEGQRVLVEAVRRWDNDYVTAAAFLMGPTLALPRRR